MPCPICDKPEARAYKPFCSRRCADIDLGNWLNESYAIPAEDSAFPDDDAQDNPMLQ